MGGRDGEREEGRNMKTVLKFIHKFTKLVEHFGLKSRLVVLIKTCLIKKACSWLR